MSTWKGIWYGKVGSDKSKDLKINYSVAINSLLRLQMHWWFAYHNKGGHGWWSTFLPVSHLKKKLYIYWELFNLKF